MKRCNRCFGEYSDEINICPQCGQEERIPVKEARHLDKETILSGRYMLGNVIGAGGFGITYKAYDQVLKQVVAIKEYLPGEFSTRIPGVKEVSIFGGEKKEQFLNGKSKFIEEARKLAKLQKVPGVVSVYNSFEENETAYLVMEYLEGKTLESLIQEKGKLEEDEAIRITITILDALQVVHAEGILHRDIAPNNIFLTTEGEVKLLDFGAARTVVGSHSKSLTVLYKEGFTPPEQYSSRGEQGTWTDIYALAATCYNMLTGIVPPGALDRRLNDTLKSPLKAGARLSGNVNYAVMNALNIDVKNRTQDAHIFRTELTQPGKRQNRFVRTYEKKVGEIPIKLKIIIGAAALMVGAAIVLLYFVGFNLSQFLPASLGVPEGMVRVPNLINMEIDKATQSLDKRQLKIQITDKQFSNIVPKGKILSQSIESGNIVSANETIDVVISGGEKTQENGYELEENENFVPDLQYKSLQEVQDALEESFFYTSFVFEKNDQIQEGDIISQSLEAGSVITTKNIEEILRVVVSSPDVMQAAYETMEENRTEELSEIHQDLTDYMTNSGLPAAFYSPQDAVKGNEDGYGLSLILNQQNLIYYLGGHMNSMLHGKGKYVIRCNCGGPQEFMSFEGDWIGGNANGHGIVRSHWTGGGVYTVEGEFINDYGEGTMQIEWEESGSTFHGEFHVENYEVQAAPDTWYSQYFMPVNPEDIIYAYSKEVDAAGIPLTCLTLPPGTRITLWGFTSPE